MPKRRVGRTAKQKAASKKNLVKARAARQMPTAKQIAMWKTTTRPTVWRNGLGGVVNTPVMRSGSRVVAFFPPQKVKYLETKTQNVLVDFLKANVSMTSGHEERVRKYLKAKSANRKRRPVAKIAVKKP